MAVFAIGLTPAGTEGYGGSLPREATVPAIRDHTGPEHVSRLGEAGMTAVF
jgi:hypothetical protein